MMLCADIPLKFRSMELVLFPHPTDMQSIIETLRGPNFIVFVVVYLSFLLDNILLTVVVPIIPDYLFANDVYISNDSSNGYLGPTSLSPLQRKFEALENDNGPLGALLASKAFVQLIFTPLVGYITTTVGYSLPLLIGSCNMLLAAILFAYGNSYRLLVMARALHGSSSAAIAVSGMCILAKTVPKDLRTRLMPIAFGGIALGVLIGYPLGGAIYQFLGKQAPFLLISLFISFNIGLQMNILSKKFNEEAERCEVADIEWHDLLNDKQTIIATSAICISTSSMAILEPCVPMWLMAHSDPPPSHWQLGAVFIPDSIGYFIGSHFAGLLPIDPWRAALSAMVIGGLSCCGIPLANSIYQLSVPHFGLGLSVGAVDAILVPYLATIVDKKGSNQYGPVYAIQQASISIAYLLGPLIGGEAVHVMGFPWLMRMVGFMNLAFCPFLIFLESSNTKEGQSALIPAPNQLTSYSSLENTSPSNDEWE